MTQNWWRSVDAHFQDQAGSMSLFFSIIEAANTSKRRQWRTKVDILRLIIGYLNVTLNRWTQIAQPDIGTNRSRQTQRNPHVDMYRHGVGPTRGCKAGYCRGACTEPNCFCGLSPDSRQNTRTHCQHYLCWSGESYSVVKGADEA